MAASDVGHHYHIRYCDPGQAFHLAEVRNTHFHNGHFMFLPDGKNGQGKSDLIIEVACGFLYTIFRAKNRSDHFFGTGFTHASHNTDNDAG